MSIEEILRKIIREELSPIHEEIAELKSRLKPVGPAGYMSTAEAAKYLSLTTGWIRTLANSRQLKSFSDGPNSKKKFLKADLDAFMATMRKREPEIVIQTLKEKKARFKTRKGKGGNY